MSFRLRLDLHNEPYFINFLILGLRAFANRIDVLLVAIGSPC